MADNEFSLPMDYEPAEDISVNAVQATEDPGKFLQEGSGPAVVETSLDKVSDAGTASKDWLVESFAQAATGTFNSPDLWKNRKPTTVEEIGRSLVHGFTGPVKSTLSGVVKTAAYAEAAMEDAEHGLAELIVGRSFPNRNFGRALIHSMNEKERSEAWERTLYENRQGIKSDAWYNMLSSAFGSSATLFGAAVAGVPAKTLAGAEGLMIGASYFSKQSSKLESAGESGAKALPFSVFIGTLGGLIAKTGGEAIISDAVQNKFGPAAVSFARSSTDNLVKRISKRLLNPVAKKAAKAEAIEEVAQEASTIGLEKIQDVVLGTQVNQSTWQEDVQRMLVGLAGGATVGGLVGEYVYNKNLNQLQKKLEPVFDGDKNKAFEAATAIADAVLNESVAENAAVKSLEGHVADLNPELAQVLSHVFEDLVNQGFVDFRQATPDEVRQAGLDWANLMSAAAILDAMERNIPLRTHPLFKAIAEIDRILLEGRDPSTGDLLPLDINNAQVRELANQIEDYIEQNRETRQAEEASKLAALREADMRARQATIQELERAAIAELEKEQVEKNQERITELQQQITELQHQMDLLREERSQYVKERAAQGRISIARAKAQTTPDNKALTKKAIRSGNLDIIKQILQDNGFKTRDLSGTQIKQMAQLNWEMFAGKDLGTTKSKYDQNVAIKAIEQNVVSGDAVLLRAGYTQGQIDKMDDQTWNRALLAAYREETEALESVQPQLTPEQAAQIPDDLQYQDTPFGLAAENARLDEIYPEYTGETIEVNGVERPTKNSDGQPIAKSEPALRNFYKWFGDSKVVDEQGRPLVVYHGTKDVFDTFETKRDNRYDSGQLGTGFYFTDSKESAEDYADWKRGNGDKIVMPLYVKIEKPLVLEKDTERLGTFGRRISKQLGIKIPESASLINQSESDAITEKATSLGYNGVIAETNFGETYYVAFEPNQIKSTENTGEFGIGVNNMYHQDQIVENPVLLDLEDITSDMNVDSVLDLVLSGQDMWDNLIDPVKYKNALQEFVKNGQLIRTKTEDVEQWFETIVRNTALLDTITDIVGHSAWFPETEIKEYFFGTNRAEADRKFQEYKKQLQARDEELPPEFATAEVESTANEEISDGAVLWKLLEDKGFFDNARLPDGSPAWSDYGLRPLWEIIGEYHEGMSAEQVLVLINKALDVYHQNGDLASAFIKGGAETAEKISNDYPLDNMMQYQPGYVSLPVPEMIGGKFDKSDKLVVTHGISLNSINKALALGGLPSPSIAISKATDPLTDFGTIKLVGTKEMIDPENEQNLVYDRDIWSATFPRPVYKNATKTASDKFRDKFRNAFIKADEEDLLLDNILYLALNSANPGQVVNMFADSFGAQIYYLENVLGKTIDVPMTERYNLEGIYFLKPDQRFIDEVAKIDINESYDAWKGTFRKAVNDLIAREGVEDRYQNIISRVYEYYDDLAFSIAVRMVQNIKNYAQNNGLKVNRLELQNLLDAYSLYGDKNYEKWASDQTESLLGEPKIKVGNKKLDWTLDNITKAMIQKSVVNSATEGYSIGNIIAAGGKKLESLEEIKSEGRKLKTKTDSEAETDSIGKRITDFASDILSQFEESGNSTFDSSVEDVYRALVKAANLGSITESTLNNLLNKALEPKERINFDKEVLKEGVQFTKEIAGLTRYFFEAKPQRSVRFEEFVGAIVPPDASYDEVASSLVGRGLVVIRTDDIKGGVEAIEQIKQGTVFQNKKTSKSTTGLGTEHRGGYDPMTKAIIFNKTSDLTTLFHESAHYWFDRNLRYYRTGLASPEWKKKWEDVMNELGATPNARGTIPVSAIRSASEKFARSMEAYLREGKYESAAIQWAHQDYANMVKRVYRNIWSTYWGLDDLSPAVKQWFDMFGLKTDDATTAFAEEDKIETDEQMVGAVIAEDATEPDVDAETKTIVADAGAQVVENPATQEIAVVPADPFETGKKARSKLPRSAEAATGVSMDDIIYNRRSMSDAFKAAQQLVNTDPVRAWEILKGGQEMVNGLYAGDIYRALIAKYQAENNPTMLKNVVQAFAGAARRAGRSVKAFDLESPRISFEKTINSLDKIFDTKKNDKRIEKVKNELKEFLHDPSALRVGWEEFKNIVGCK